MAGANPKRPRPSNPKRPQPRLRPGRQVAGLLPAPSKRRQEKAWHVVIAVLVAGLVGSSALTAVSVQGGVVALVVVAFLAFVVALAYFVDIRVTRRAAEMASALRAGGFDRTFAVAVTRKSLRDTGRPYPFTESLYATGLFAVSPTGAAWLPLSGTGRFRRRARIDFRAADVLAVITDQPFMALPCLRVRVDGLSTQYVDGVAVAGPADLTFVLADRLAKGPGFAELLEGTWLLARAITSG